MKKLLLLCFITGFVAAKAQNIVLAEWFGKLEPKQFYFAGQGHNNQANIIIENELLLALNIKYHVRYCILEYAHSTAFLINQYLQSGNDSLLKFIQAEAGFTYIRSVKAHNDSLPDNRKIRFYGLDFENRHDGKYTRKAIALILQQVSIPVTETLAAILQNTVQSSPDGLGRQLLLLKTWLNNNEATARTLLKQYYTDLLLIANAAFNFSPRRDDAMYENFHRLYKELIKTEAEPSFFGSFGIGHINPGNKNGIAMQLRNNTSSMVKNKVSIIGVQYFDCVFGPAGTPKSTYGSLDFLCNNAIVRDLYKKEAGQQQVISWLSADQLSALNCNKAIEGLDGVIVVRKFGGTAFWEWE